MHTSWLLVSLGLSITNATPHEEPKDLPNSNHIFNAIHSSMRQWGSSLNHNGMSLFLATVPQGTQLYHGTSSAERINGTQWLAFEPEHALVFARSRRGGGPPSSGKSGPPGPRENEGDNEWHPPERIPDHDVEEEEEEWHVSSSPKTGLKARAHHHPHGDPREWEPRPFEHQGPSREEEEESHGYLHTYLPNRNLRLLYIDGQSAAKSDKGTMDMQDIVLLQKTPPPRGDEGGPPGGRHLDDSRIAGGRRSDRRSPPPPPPPGGKGRKGGSMNGPMSEGFRAEHLCSLAANEWQGRIDGFIRMELGFEIILCDFGRDLDLLRITQVEQTSGGPGGPGGPPQNNEDSFAYYRAVASRFDGIGGNRVQLHYESMISLFSEPEAIYFEQKTGLPRVRNDSEVLEPLFQRITDMILSSHHEKQGEGEQETNWQATTDMLIARYSNLIAHLTTPPTFTKPLTLQKFHAEIHALLKPFIASTLRDPEQEISRCATQFLPHPPPLSLSAQNLPYETILSVSTHLCSTLHTASQIPSLRQGVLLLRELKEWLDWTSWKKCPRGCREEEVCFVPIWPLGSEKERERPRCIAGMGEVGRGYWGGMGGPPPPPSSSSSSSSEFQMPSSPPPPPQRLSWLSWMTLLF